MLADNNFPEIFLRKWPGNHRAGEEGPFEQLCPAHCSLCPSHSCLCWAGSSGVLHHIKSYHHLRWSQAFSQLALWLGLPSFSEFLSCSYCVHDSPLLLSLKRRAAMCITPVSQVLVICSSEVPPLLPSLLQ